jgi:hypothetical protein
MGAHLALANYQFMAQLLGLAVFAKDEWLFLLSSHCVPPANSWL